MAPEKFAKDSALRLTMREMQRDFRSSAIWISILAVGAVVGVVGPFGTDQAMLIVPRIAYWAVVVCLTFWLGAFVATLVINGLAALEFPKWPSAICAGVLAGVAISFELVLFNVLLFGTGQFDWASLQATVLNVVAITLIVTLGFVAIESQRSPQQPELPGQALPRLVDRLPFEKRGDLISISVDDHYVSVVTTKGTELLLMRLGDAIGETSGTHGMQVHRSHWVALDHVTAARRDGAKAVLTVTGGMEIPVSRTYVPALKTAGVLE